MAALACEAGGQRVAHSERSELWVMLQYPRACEAGDSSRRLRPNTITGEDTMTHSFTDLNYHVVFSTKEFNPMIDPEWKDRLYEYLGGVIRSLNGICIEINGMPDHVHSLVRLHQDMPISTFMEKLKSNSSGWVKRTLDNKFSWQIGYGAFTVSESGIEKVTQYIRDQARHHQKMTFEEEFIKLLKAHNIEFDRKYLFK